MPINKVTHLSLCLAALSELDIVSFLESNLTQFLSIPGTRKSMVDS